jgi:hypothetical protein
MAKFKVGDFVKHKRAKSKHIVTHINSGEFGNKISTTNPLSFDAEFEDDYELWEPELLEIVWYLSLHQEAALMRYVGRNGNYYQCKDITGEAVFNCLHIEPFIGLLPVRIQNKLKDIKDGTNLSKNN